MSRAIAAESLAPGGKPFLPADISDPAVAEIEEMARGGFYSVTVVDAEPGSRAARYLPDQFTAGTRESSANVSRRGDGERAITTPAARASIRPRTWRSSESASSWVAARTSWNPAASQHFASHGGGAVEIVANVRNDQSDKGGVSDPHRSRRGMRDISTLFGEFAHTRLHRPADLGTIGERPADRRHRYAQYLCEILHRHLVLHEVTRPI